MLSTKILLQHIINQIWHRPLSFVARLINFYPDKKITIIGVTGTDGKTTTATLIYHVLKNAGHNVSLISTVEAKIGHQTIDVGLHTTSPDKFKTFKLIRQMVRSGSRYLVAEVTAHALDQYRFGNIIFDIGIITNTSREHLDDFATMDNYIKTKIKLLAKSKYAIINKDDNSYTYTTKLTNAKATYSIDKPSQFQAKRIRISPTTMSFTVKKLKFSTNSTYKYQIYNILAAYIACKKLKIKHQLFQQTIVNFPTIKGRREELENNLDIRTIIDFAHTPKALEETLGSLKKNTTNRLIVVFGATGGRDQGKRPMMGKAVYQHSNIALITADDTRNENIVDINKQIIAGIPAKNSQQLTADQIKKISPHKFNYFDIANRQDAFNLAVKIAKPGDTIIACGKGHETSILHGKTDYPWSEAEAFRLAFKLKN